MSHNDGCWCQEAVLKELERLCDDDAGHVFAVSDEPGSTRTRFNPAQCFAAPFISTVERLSVTAIQDQRPRIVISGLLPLSLRLEHPSAIVENCSIFTERQSLCEIVESRAVVATPDSNNGPVRPRIGQQRIHFDGPRESIGCGGMMSDPHLDQALQAKHPCVVRPVLKNMGDIAACQREIAAFTQQDSAIQSRIDEVRLQNNNPPVSSYRFVIPMQGGKHLSAIKMGFDMGRLPSNRHIVVAQRRLVSICPLMDETAIEPGCAVARLLRQQRSQLTYCKVVTTGRHVQTCHIV